MRTLSPAGHDAVNAIAQRHGFSFDATLHMLDAVINGNGSMAQFNHPEFAGSGQWMRGGMTMVSDMFNNALKGRVDALCADLSQLVASQPDLVRSGSFQSQSQGGGGGFQSQGSGGYQSQGGGGWNSSSSSSGGASLFVPPPPGTSGDWWPSDLRWPDSTGAQNNVRYAYFSQARRLAIDVNGSVTVYDTLDHQIGGFSQQQSYGGSPSFNSQYGLIDVASLPVVWRSGGGPVPAPQAPAWTPAPQPSQAPRDSGGGGGSGSGNAGDVFATIERLAELAAKGIISADEFNTKKAELLSRL